jgi:hypothetical protein
MMHCFFTKIAKISQKKNLAVDGIVFEINQYLGLKW